MKLFLVICAFTIFASNNVLASSKICFWSANNNETKGAILNVETSDAALSIRNIKGDFDYEGVFIGYNSTVNGRDGHVYYEFKGRNSDYQDVIMLDEALFNDGTTGLLQFRARGEGFFNSVFVCRDARPKRETL
jgi:hypothetical protein